MATHIQSQTSSTDFSPLAEVNRTTTTSDMFKAVCRWFGIQNDAEALRADPAHGVQAVPNAQVVISRKNEGSVVHASGVSFSSKPRLPPPLAPKSISSDVHILPHDTGNQRPGVSKANSAQQQLSNDACPIADPSIPSINITTHASRQQFVDYGAIVSTTDPFVWKFPGTKVWVGSETLFPIPEEVQTLWERVKGGLLATLEAVEGEMMREQSQEPSLRKRHVRRRRFMTELRMSGCCQKLKTGKDRKVNLYPCVWILCGSKWCRNKIRKATERLELPQNLSSQRIEVHEGGPTFNASEVNIPRSQLDNDRALVPGVAHSGGTILHHIEVSPKQECGSICGILCCTTFVKDGNVIDQHVSRIGGVLTETFFDLDYKIWPLALTTAHGIFDLLLSEASDDCELKPDSGKSKYLQTSASVHSSDSESVYDTDEESSESEAEIEVLGDKSASSVTKWTRVEDVVGINFMGERLSSKEFFDRGPPADYTILRSDVLNSCRNIISSDPSVEVTTFVLNSHLTSGPVSLIIGVDELWEPQGCGFAEALPSAV
ncbi:uncharacterized protein CCOS01_12217 [Colletotrichum costaricense]|uniref:Uncharacterized protein n=1 Tax=Colletotrichum costaricense TaxID=1209916 RepID=A0AAJ0DX24_9PEZI|nr:uncharacterized protein CCOS01_12217 [Colletotrichum costaricense]KAK1517960.1 hypothetical protein CCOS01_12217 [Colletotrichum costaricense]